MEFGIHVGVGLLLALCVKNRSHVNQTLGVGRAHCQCVFKHQVLK